MTLKSIESQDKDSREQLEADVKAYFSNDHDCDPWLNECAITAVILFLDRQAAITEQLVRNETEQRIADLEQLIHDMWWYGINSEIEYIEYMERMVKLGISDAE